MGGGKRGCSEGNSTLVTPGLLTVPTTPDMCKRKSPGAAKVEHGIPA